MKIPAIITTENDKIRFLSRVAELLRLEHNQKGKDFRDGIITEKEFRNYQKYDLELRLQNVLYELGKIENANGVTRFVGDSPVNPSARLQFQTALQNGKSITQWDSHIDLKSIEKAGNGITDFDPIEDFTTYTETDPVVYLSKDVNTATWTNLTRNVDAYIYADKTAGHFNGNFEHWFDVRITACLAAGNVACYALTDVVDDSEGIETNNNNELAFSNIPLNDTVPRFGALEIMDGDKYWSAILYTGVLNTTYYIKAKRDEAVDFGSLSCYIYSDSARSNLLSTPTLALHAKKDLQYVFAVQSNNGGAAYAQSGYTENLDLKEAITGPFPTHFNP